MNILISIVSRIAWLDWAFQNTKTVARQHYRIILLSIIAIGIDLKLDEQDKTNTISFSFNIWKLISIFSIQFNWR